MTISCFDSPRRASERSASADPGAGTGDDPVDPVSNAHFRVLIDKEEIAVARISALQTPASGATQVDGALSIRLTRAIDGNRLLWEWRRAAAAGRRRRRRVRILHRRRPGDRVPLNVFTLIGAEPLRWTGPRFDAIEPDVALEEIEISYRTVVWPFTRLNKRDASQRASEVDD